MTRQEAMKLRPGDRVIIWQGTHDECQGTVNLRAIGTSWVWFDWDDGQHTGIHPTDMVNVERAS